MGGGGGGGGERRLCLRSEVSMLLSHCEVSFSARGGSSTRPVLQSQPTELNIVSQVLVARLSYL